MKWEFQIIYKSKRYTIKAELLYYVNGELRIKVYGSKGYFVVQTINLHHATTTWTFKEQCDMGPASPDLAKMYMDIFMQLELILKKELKPC